MAEISRVALFGKLNSITYRAIESAMVFCKLRGNPFIEIVHWLHQLLQLQDSDIHRLARHFNLDAARLAHDVLEALDRLPRGSSSVSDLSAHVEQTVEQAWLYSSLLYGQGRVRSAHLILGIIKSPNLKNVLLSISREFAKISPDALSDNLSTIVQGSPEDAGPGEVSPSASDEYSAAGAPLGKQEALRKFTVDLTAQAREGKMDPVLGRDQEIRQLIDILMRRRQNNPLLTGEAGVGKTAVVEGFAARVVAGDVPPALRDVSVRALDIGLLQAGASMKGEFESRLRGVIDEVLAAEKPIILFIDEAHTLIGAGGTAGTGDAANLLKPALARGTLRTIAATTWAEYKKHIEKDPALTRRFQVVQVLEPSEDKAVRMLRGVVSAMEKHHKVQVLDEAVVAAVKLSHRYIPARQLPDKAVSLLDTACARVAVSQHGTPAEIEDATRRIEALEAELEIMRREREVGIESVERATSVASTLTAEQERLAALQVRCDRERTLVDEILDLQGKLRATPPEPGGEIASLSPESPAPATLTLEERDGLRGTLITRQQALRELQGDRPLILPTVDAQAVGAVVADWTGIPVGRMVKDEIMTVLNLEEHLVKRVIGQDHALQMIAKWVRTSRAHLDNPNRPIGVFMLAGPSGVGKTETALALAEVLYGGDQNVITINMSEFQEAHTVSTLKGAPPGYVGYGEGGVLTEAVRRRPYSVVLLDEVEKAHPDVHEIFFQVFDKGIMEDGEGRMIDFKNTLILLTTNAGTDLVMSMCRDPELMPDPESLATAMRDPLLKIFPPALLGRMVAIPYYPLSDKIMGDIIRLQIGRIQKRVNEHYGVELQYGDEVVTAIAERCTQIESGGRMIDAILTNSILPKISEEFLNRTIEGKPFGNLLLGADATGFTYHVAE